MRIIDEYGITIYVYWSYTNHINRIYHHHTRVPARARRPRTKRRPASSSTNQNAGMCPRHARRRGGAAAAGIPWGDETRGRHTSTRRSREDSTTDGTESCASPRVVRASWSEKADPMARTTTGGRRRARDDGCRRAMAVGALVALGAVAGGRSVSAEKISTLVGNYVTSPAGAGETLGTGANSANALPQSPVL